MTHSSAQTRPIPGDDDKATALRGEPGTLVRCTGRFYFEPSALGFGGTGEPYNHFIADKVQITKDLTILPRSRLWGLCGKLTVVRRSTISAASTGSAGKLSLSFRLLGRQGVVRLGDSTAQWQRERQGLGIRLGWSVIRL